MQQGLARARDATRLVAVVFRVVVLEHGLDALERFPGDVRRVDVVDADLPLVDGQALQFLVCRRRPDRRGTRAAVDERPRVGRVLQDLQDGGDRRLLPDHVAETIAAGQQEVVLIKVVQDPGRRAHLQESGEDQGQAVLHLPVRVFDHAAEGIAYQPHRERQRQLAPLRLVEEARRQTGADGMQLQFGELSLQAQEQAAIGRTGIVDAIAIGDQAAPIAAHIEQRIPIGAVPG